MIYKMQQRRPSIMFPAIILLLFSLSSYSFGESVFLKDGKILEGKISKENDKKITITLSSDEAREIDRKDIIRTVYHSDYKDKRYLTKMDGTVLEVFIVDEDKTGYTYRLKLDSADEVRIPKDEVDGISKRKVTAPVAREETREEKLVTRAPRLRFGLTMSGPGDAVDEYAEHISDFGTFHGAFADLFLYRMRDEKGNGLDFFIRGVFNAYELEDNDDLGLGYETLPALYEWEDTEITQIAYGGGIRYNRGIYFAGFLWQGYLMAYYQYSKVSAYVGYIVKEPTYWSNEHLDYDYTSHGVIGGAGLEVGLFKYLGVFCEYTYGYSKVSFPAGDENIEGGAIRFGVSIRTSYF